jgi:hypothetical protein
MAQQASPLTGFYTEADTYSGYFGNIDTGLMSNTTARSHRREVIFPSPGLTVSGKGTAVADLSLGALHASAGLLSTTIPGSGDFGVQSITYFGDDLFFTVSGAPAGRITTVHFVVRTHAKLVPGAGYSLGQQEFGLLDLGVGAETFYEYGAVASNVVAAGGAHAAFGPPQLPYSGTYSASKVIKGSFKISGPSASVPIEGFLVARGQFGLTSVTAVISLCLPTGVTFTSASGAFP